MTSKTLRVLFFAALAMLIGVPLALLATQDEPAAAAADPPHIEAYDKSAANCPEAKTDDRPEPEPKYYWDDDNLTPLHEAAKVNDVAEVKRLIAAGADVNAKGESGTTPLILAAHKGATEALAELLKAGADTEAKYGRGGNALFSAISGNDYNSIELLLKAGANVNAKSDEGITPLHNANSPEVAELLIEYGADVNARLNGADDEMLIGNGNETPLHTTHSAEVAKVLIKHGADVNARDDSKRTPLHNAVYRSCDLVISLIHHCADLWAENANGRTPLKSIRNNTLGGVTGNWRFDAAERKGPGYLQTLKSGMFLRSARETEAGGLPAGNPIWKAILERNCNDTILAGETRKVSAFIRRLADYANLNTSLRAHDVQ